MNSLTDDDVIDNSDVNHLEGGLQPRGEMIDHLVARLQSAAHHPGGRCYVCRVMSFIWV
jgi:hypothetical protein